MQSTSQPAKTTTNFASSGLVQTVPELASGAAGAEASFEAGFPAITMQPISLGGLAPIGKQFNKLYNLLFGYKQWQEAGGQATYDSAYSTAIGGYPKGAILARVDLNGYWISTAENNTSNPDTGGAGWISFNPDRLTTTGGATGAFTLAPTASAVSYTPGDTYLVKFHAAGNGTDTIAVSGLGAVSLKQYNATGAKTNPVITADFHTYIMYDGTNFIILNPLPPATGAGATVGLRISADHLDHTTYFKFSGTTWVDVTDFSKAITVTNAGVVADVRLVAQIYCADTRWPMYFQLLVNGGEYTNEVVDFRCTESTSNGTANVLQSKILVLSKCNLSLAQNATYTFRLQAKNSASSSTPDNAFNASENYPTSRDPETKSIMDIVTYKA